MTWPETTRSPLALTVTGIVTLCPENTGVLDEEVSATPNVVGTEPTVRLVMAALVGAPATTSSPGQVGLVEEGQAAGAVPHQLAVDGDRGPRAVGRHVDLVDRLAGAESRSVNTPSRTSWFHARVISPNGVLSEPCALLRSPLCGAMS